MPQVTLNASENAYLIDSSPTTNNGNGVVESGEHGGAAIIYRSLIQWDLSSIPSGSTIDSVTMKLYLTANSASNDRIHRVYRVRRDWVESEATWNSYSSGNSWGTAGCANTTTDRESSDVGNLSLAAAETTSEYKDWTISTTAVQEWLDGDFTNNGLLIKADTETDDRHIFNGRSGGNPPQLVVDYTAPLGGSLFYSQV